MKIIFATLTCIALSILCPLPASCGETDWLQLGNGLAAEKISHIEPADLWHSASENTYRSSDGLIVGFWPIDPESAKREDGWTMVGLVLSGLGDVAESPLAIRLWSKEQLSFGANETVEYGKKNQKVALFFYPARCTDPGRCSRKLAAVVLQLEGLSGVLINNRKLGAIK